MVDKLKMSGGRFACAVVLLVALAYPVSLGPACWISSWTDWAPSVVTTAFQPLMRAGYRISPSTFRWASWYSRLLAAKNWFWFIEANADAGGASTGRVNFEWAFAT
jgi:hypothetical protein